MTYGGGQVVETLGYGGQAAYGGQVIETFAQAAPMMQTYAAPAFEIDQFNAFGQVVERDFVQQVAPRDLLAMGNVISERVITIEELAASDRYGEAEAVMVAPQILEVDTFNAYGQVVERDFVGGGFVETMGAPVYASTLVAPTIVEQFGQGGFVETVGAPVFESYGAGGFVESFAAPTFTSSAVSYGNYGASTTVAPVSYGTSVVGASTFAAPTTTAYGASSFAAPVTAAYSGASTYAAPTTTAYGGASTFAAPITTAAYGGASTYAGSTTAAYGASSYGAPVSTVI